MPGRKMVIVLLLTVVTLTLTSCAPPAPAAPAQQQPAPAATQPPTAAAAKAAATAAPAKAADAAAKPTTLKWFLRWDQARLDSVANPVIQEYKKAHPNVTIELENIGTGTDYYTKLQTMIAGGTPPDVFYPATHIAYALASKGAIQYLDEYIARDKIDLSKYDKAVLDLYTINGKVTCLPIDSANLVVFYNKTMFDAAKVAYPKAGWTWDDFVKTAKALTKDTNGDGRIDQWGVDSFRSYWPVMVWSNTGHGLFDDIRKPAKYIANDDASIASIQWLADLSLKDRVMPTDEERAKVTDLFAANKTAMNVIGHWRVPTYMAVKDLKFDYVALPIGKFGKPVNRADGSCYAISAKSKDPEAAWQFVKYLAGPGAPGVAMLLDLQQMVPALAEFQKDPRFLNPAALPGTNKEAFLAGKENLFTMYDPIHPMYSAYDAAWKQEFGDVWLGKATAREAVARLDTTVKDMLKNIKDYE